MDNKRQKTAAARSFVNKELKAGPSSRPIPMPMPEGQSMATGEPDPATSRMLSALSAMSARRQQLMETPTSFDMPGSRVLSPDRAQGRANMRPMDLPGSRIFMQQAPASPEMMQGPVMRDALNRMSGPPGMFLPEGDRSAELLRLLMGRRRPDSM
jgi:hypothetical protein